MSLFNWRMAPIYRAQWPMAAKDKLIAWPEFPTRPGESSFMLMKTLAALAFTTGVILSGSAPADPAKFDGTWSVSLVSSGGLCGGGTSSTLMVQNGSVRAGGAGVSVSGQVGPSGSEVRQPGFAEEWCTASQPVSVPVQASCRVIQAGSPRGCSVVRPHRLSETRISLGTDVGPRGGRGRCP